MVSGVPTISVVICTFNRADLLAAALESVCVQTIDPCLYEIIVVDNNSMDNTNVVVDLSCRRHFNIRYYRESQQGLSHARNRGWREARGEYVAYCDDDCRVPEQWLAVAADIIRRVSPGAFGGPYYAFYQSAKPRWFKDSYGSHTHGEEARLLDLNEFLDGGNFFCRRSLLEEFGGFNSALGMSGRKIAFGEETAFLRAVRSSKPQELIYYDPKLYVYHLVAARKMTLGWLIRQRFLDGRYSYRVFGDELRKTGSPTLVALKAVGAAAIFCLDLARAVVGRDRVQYPYWQNYLYEHSFRYVRMLGGLYEHYRQPHAGAYVDSCRPI
jgi:glycosyltransferase involved in cell wall biosynthesis